MDNLSKSQRSYCMSRIRAKDTKPEIIVRRILHRLGYRFRLHRRDLPGAPDIVLPRYRFAIFVHGCFWHQHPGCRRATLPVSNVEYWTDKLAWNITRSNEAIAVLEQSGWRIAVVWECETKDLEALRLKIIRFLQTE